MAPRTISPPPPDPFHCDWDPTDLSRETLRVPFSPETIKIKPTALTWDSGVIVHYTVCWTLSQWEQSGIQI